MFCCSGRFRTILCLAFFLGSQAEVGVVEKAYQNVVVSFSPRLSSENATHLVSSLQKVFKEASSVLQEAVGLRIGSVTFHLPRTWNNVSLEGVTLAPGPVGEQQHDIYVDALSDSAFGKYPHAIQYGGCGTPGLEISMPDIFLTEEDNYPRGKILAKEWLKYRYGVFDENGFPDDPMYPTHYTVAGSDDVHVTDCTFPEVEYEFRDSEDNNCTLSSDTESNCFIHPKGETAENISSSLMFYHKELPQVNHICGTDDHLHNKDSPNKQNLLCFYNSVSEIVKSSGDFTNEENNQGADEDQDITYYYVKESDVRLVVAYQNTNGLNKQGPTVLKALWKLLHDLSLIESEVAIYDFKEDLNQIRALSKLTYDSFRNVPLTSEFRKAAENPCPSCAVKKAVEVLLEDSTEKPGTILIITASNPPENYLNDRLNNSKLCLIVIGFEDASEDKWSKIIENSACGSFKKISETENSAIFKNLYETIELILPEPTDDTRITTVTTDSLTEDTDFIIPADENAGMYTLWVFGSKDDESIMCKVEDEKINLLKVEESSVYQALSVYLLQPEVVEDIKCKLVDSESVLAQAQMKSKPGAYFNFRAWTFDTTPKNETVQMPVIIYASLSYGQYPVLNAEVKAIVTHLDGQKTTELLFDNGLSGPDVTQNDGIYSGYFTDFNSEGIYEVEVHATMKDQQTKIGKQGQDPCCGSIVINEAFNVSSFDLKTKTKFKAISKKPEKGYKPSRVVDLKVDRLDFPKNVFLKWSAPGGEMDKGQAYQYDFKIFCQHKDCNDSGVFPNWIILSNNLKPQEFGKEEKLTLGFSENVPENIVIYVSLKAISKELQPGDSSNLVPVKLSQSETLEEITTPVTTTNDRKPKSPEAGVIVAYVMIALACLILIAGVIFFVLERKRRRKIPDDLNTPVGFNLGNDNKGFNFPSSTLQKENAMERAESLPVQLYTHDQIKDIKEKHKDSPKQRSKDTPMQKSGMPSKSWQSLDALSGDVRNMDKKSSDSISITQIDLKKTNEDEIKQLDDISQRSIPIVVRDSKF